MLFIIQFKNFNQILRVYFKIKFLLAWSVISTIKSASDF